MKSRAPHVLSAVVFITQEHKQIIKHVINILIYANNGVAACTLRGAEQSERLIKKKNKLLREIFNCSAKTRPLRAEELFARHYCRCR